MVLELNGRGRSILLVEDEPQIADVLAAYLEREGFKVLRAADGQLALDMHLRHQPALVLLDIRLPKMDGIEVLNHVRRRGATPVIMVTAMAEDLDRLLGLRLGADDYVAKPFNPAEVVARVHAVLRRTQGALSAQSSIQYGCLSMDPAAMIASVLQDGKAVALPLTLTEFRMLYHLARSPGRVFTRGDLIDACMSESDATDRAVDSHLSNLRRKLENAGQGKLIETVRGVGYRAALLT